MATFTERTVEAQRLLVKDVEGHSLHLQRPDDLIFRVGDADNLHQVRFVAHDGEQYRDVAFVTHNRFSAIQVETPSICFRDAADAVLSRIEFDADKDARGKIEFWVNDGDEDANVLCLDGEGARVTHLMAENLSVADVFTASRIEVCSDGTVAAEFSITGALEGVKIQKIDAELSVIAPRVKTHQISAERADLGVLRADDVYADGVTASHISMQEWVFDTLDSDLNMSGPGAVTVHDLRADSIDAVSAQVTHFSVVTHRSTLAEFGNATVSRLSDGSVAWCGGVCTDVVTSKSGELDLQANTLSMSEWAIEASPSAWCLRNHTGKGYAIYVDDLCTRIRGLCIRENEIVASTINTEHHCTRSLEVDEANVHEISTNDIVSVTARMSKLRVRDVTAISVCTDNITGGVIDVSAESLRIAAATVAAGIECESLVAPVVTVNDGVFQTITSQRLNVADVLIGESGNVTMVTSCEKVGIHTESPEADLDVVGDCIVRGKLYVGELGTLLKDDCLRLGAMRIGTERARASITSDEGGCTIELCSDVAEPFLSLTRERGVCAASIVLTERLELNCADGVRAQKSLQTETLHAKSLILTDGEVLVHDSIKVKRDDGRTLLFAGDCVGINVDIADAALHVKSSSSTIFKFQHGSESVVGIVDDGLTTSCASFTWCTPSVTSSMTSGALSVSGCIFATSSIHAHCFSSEHLSTGCVFAEQVYARDIDIDDVRLSASNGAVTMMNINSLTLQSEEDLSGGSSDATFLAFETPVSRYTIGAYGEGVCITAEGNSKLWSSTTTESRFHLPTSAPSFCTDKVVLNGPNGAKIALDYAQAQTLSRVSQFVRVEGSTLAGDIEEQTLVGLVPHDFLSAVDDAPSSTDYATVRGARNTDSVVLADVVRIDSDGLSSTVSVVAFEGVDCRGSRIVNVGDPQEPQDVVTLAYLMSYTLSSAGEVGNAMQPVVAPSVGGELQSPVLGPPVHVQTGDETVARFTSSSESARIELTSAADAFLTVGSDNEIVSFGFSDALRAFVVAGATDVSTNVWMSVHERTSAHGNYSEAQFGGHVTLRNPRPLLSLTDSVTDSHVLQLAPYTMYLGDQASARGTSSIANVGHMLQITVDDVPALRASGDGLSVATLFTSQIIMDGNVMIARDPIGDVSFAKGSDGVCSNIGDHRMWNVYHTGEHFAFQGIGHGMLQSFDKNLGTLEFGVSAVSNQIDVASAPDGVAFVAFSTPRMTLHPLGVSINSRNVSNYGLQLNGGIVIENQHTGGLEAGILCDSHGTLRLSSSSSILNVTNVSESATIVCNRISVGGFADVITPPGLSTSNAYIGDLQTLQHRTVNSITTGKSQTFVADVYALSVHNLYVSGNTTTIDVETITIPDTFIQLALGNSLDVTDTGIVSHYTENGNPRIAGLMRDASTRHFKFFESLPRDDMPLDASGQLVIDASRFQLASLDVGDIVVSNSMQSSSLTATSANFETVQTSDVATSTIGYQGMIGLSIGATYVETSALNSTTVVSDTLHTGPIRCTEIVIGNWKILSQTMQCGNGETRDELVFQHASSTARNAFRIRQPDGVH